MELKVTGGNYSAAEKGGLCTVSGQEETIQRIMMRLGARRGGFLPMPDFGSRLHSLLGMKAGDRAAAARQFVHEALEDEDALITGVQCDLEGDGLTVEVWLDISGQDAQVKIRV